MSESLIKKLNSSKYLIKPPQNFLRSPLIFPGHFKPNNILFFNCHKFNKNIGSKHHRYLIIINLKTPGIVCVDDEMFQLNVSQAKLIEPYCYHHYITPDNLNWLFLTFEAEKKDLPQLPKEVMNLSSHSLATLEAMLNIYTEKEPSINLIFRLQFLTGLFLTELAEDNKNKTSEEVIDPLIQKCIKYVYEHISEPLSNADIAQYLGLSVSRLRTVFQERYKISLGKFIRDSKFSFASRLLLTTDKRISEIAAEIGYNSIYAFSRAFQKYQKKSPREFRKEMNQSFREKE